MKKILLSLALVLTFTSTLLAQEGEIIYQEFDPPIHHYVVCSDTSMGHKFWLDLDLDGTFDMYFQELIDYRYLRGVFIELEAYNHSKFRNTNSVNWGDTIANVSDPDFVNPNFYHISEFYHDDERWAAIRWQRDNGYCYGWIEVELHCYDYLYPAYPGDPWVWPMSIDFTIHRMAFCTIPDYPLRVGQDSFEWDGINEASAFATLHPNPTSGLVTITGIDLKQVEVFNTLGQRVATASGEGETLQVDLSGLPVGVYFVNVTDGEGRKCTRKVVKE